VAAGSRTPLASAAGRAGPCGRERGGPARIGPSPFPAREPTSLRPLPSPPGPAGRRHFGELVLPNLMISLSADHVAAFTVWPHSAGHTTVVCDFLFHPDEIAKPDFDPGDAVSFWDVVNRQDWLICELGPPGMTSRRVTPRL